MGNMGCGEVRPGLGSCARFAQGCGEVQSGQQLSFDCSGKSPGSTGFATASTNPQANPGECKVLVAATEIVKLAGISAYHTSVILGSREYYFGAEGVVSAAALWSHRKAKGAGSNATKILPAGISMCKGGAMMEALQPFFVQGSYDVLHKNCNSFTDAALVFLTRRRLDACFTRLERLLRAAEPISTGVIDKLVRAFGTNAGCPGGGYQVNPLAQGFSVDDLVETLQH
eukprot:TRINITY_DN4112_c0_g1_i3.p1 TRINITY_DN4112_c0_g1~~TRINITY_DN4112_c0_g1_i3.p1  ORF type:complete len:228 (-),score=40.41 TRINITY_DN4112_c0_g1_i3:167-850(-)